MIVEALVEALFDLVGFLLSLLPNDTIDWPDGSGMGGWLGALVGPIDRLVPMAEFVAVVTLTVTVVMPAMLVYRLAMWLWALLPDSVTGTPQ